ncbi:MAG: CheR family methyltransferase, partial [Oscillospiraceae bacterium]
MKLTDDDFIRMVNYVKSNFGINLIKKRLLIEGRLSFTLQTRGFTSYKDYIDIVISDKTGAEVSFLLDKLTTNHTYFMREKEHFDFFMETVLPYLEQTVRSKELRIWSAGCSFGNEPYNLAMCISEYFGTRKQGWDCRILATDISTKVL